MNLTPAQQDEIIRTAAAIVARELIDRNREEIQLVSKAQAAGILDCDPQTLETLGIPRVMVGRAVKFRLSDIRSYIKTSTEP